MAVSLRTSLLALLAAGTLVPIAGLGWLEFQELDDARQEARRADVQAEAFAAALRADAAAASGADPLAAAAEGARADEVILVAQDGSLRSTVGGRGPWPALVETAGDSLAGDAVVARPEGGGERLVAWARAPAADALVVLVRPPSAPAGLGATPFVLLAAFIAGSVGIVLAFVVLRVLAPVARLERAARRLARGRWRERVPERGPTEVRALAHAFNEMSSALQDQRESLDSILEERTRALIDREGDLNALRFTLAHEFREPLRSLRWMADELLEGRLDPHARDAARILRQRIVDLDAVFVDLLRYEDVSRRPATIAPVALERVLSRAAAEVAVTGALVVDAEPLGAIVGDEDLLSLAFAEILRNVVQHGGGYARVVAAEHGGALHLTIDDEGPGIPPARREDALHLFQRLRRDVPGTGAGLAIARRAIERHDGELRVEEAPGGGARVAIRLPLAGPAPRAKLPREPTGRAF